MTLPPDISILGMTLLGGFIVFGLGMISATSERRIRRAKAAERAWVRDTMLAMQLKPKED